MTEMNLAYMQHSAAFIPSEREIDEHETWFHDRDYGIGLETVLQLRLIERVVTPIQTIEVYEHQRFGWVLVRDGALHAVQLDRVYSELMVHVPLLGRAFDTCDVLILGGGDGELLKEVLRHAFVRSVTLLENDQALMDLARRHLEAAPAFEDARVKICRDPGELKGRYDVLLNDGSACHTESLQSHLSAETIMVHADRVVHGKAGRRFLNGEPPAHNQIYCGLSPFVPGGYLAFFVSSPQSLARAKRQYEGYHYDAAVHEAAFACPSWLRSSSQEGNRL